MPKIDPPSRDESPPLPHLTGKTGSGNQPPAVPLYRYVAAGVVSLLTFLGVFVGYSTVVNKLTYHNAPIGSFVALLLMIISLVPAWFAARVAGRAVLGKKTLP